MKVKRCYVKNIIFVTFLYCIYTPLLATPHRADTNALRTVDGQIFHFSEFRKTRTSFVDVFQTLNGPCFLGGLGQTLRSGTVVFKTLLCVIEVAYIFASGKTITVKFFVWENTTCKELQPLELTSKNLPIATPLGDGIKNVIAELTLQANWNAYERFHRDQTKCNVMGELALQRKPL